MALLPNPLRIARTAAIVALGAVRLGGDAVRTAGVLADEFADAALTLLGAHPSDGDAFSAAHEAFADSAPSARGRATHRAPQAPPPRVRVGRPRAQPAEPGAVHSPDRPSPQPPPSAAPGESSRPRDPQETSGHVAEEEELVAAVADPGAEDGAGAEVHVDPPWPGYEKLRALDIVERLRIETEAVVSVVELYERAHRGRRSVLEATERELARRASPAVSRS